MNVEKHCHLSLREVYHLGRLVYDHHAYRQQTVTGPYRQTFNY